jgi:tungstate transport system ATP-binding protein
MYIIEGRELLIKEKNRVILDVQNIGLEQGKVTTVIGPNGSGKSTLLRTLALLQHPQKGNIFFKGRKVERRDEIQVRRRMAVVFQEALLLNASVIENVTVGLRIRGIEKSQERKRGLYWLEKFRVSHLAKRWAKTLSGGEAQRVSLARAFALSPEVIFLDEPFTNLDSSTREDLLEELSEVLHSTNVTTFFVSHDFEEVMFLSDMAIALINGKVIQRGTPQALRDNPKSENLRRLVRPKKFNKC